MINGQLTGMPILANLGTRSDFTARTTFAKNFFEAGDIEAITNDGFANLDNLVEAFKVSGVQLVCLFSSNDIYARQAAVTATELWKSSGTSVYLAGRPGELEGVLKAAGVRSLIYAGCDVLAVLQGAHAFLGIECGSVH